MELGVATSKLDAGLRAAQRKVKAFAQGIQDVGVTMAKVGIAIGAPLALAAHSFSNFESAMARLRAVLGDVTDGDLQALESQARKMGLETAYSAREAAEGMVEFGIAGFKARDIVAAIHPTLDLAAAGMIEVKDAAKISARVINDMGYSATQLRAVLDVIGKAATSGGTNITDLGEAFKFMGPIAQIAGVQLTEIIAAVQLLGKSGIEADMAGTGLRGILMGMNAPTDEARKKFQELGITVGDAKGNFRGIAAVLADIEKASEGLGTTNVIAQLGAIIPNDRAMTALAALVNKGSAALAKQDAVLQNSAGTTSKVASIQLNTLRGAWMLLTSSLEGFGIVIGKAVAPVLRQIGESLMFVTNAVALLSEKNPDLFRTLAKVSVALIAGGAALIAFGLTAKLALAALAVPVAIATAAFGLLFSKVGLGALIVGDFVARSDSIRSAMGALGTSVMGAGNSIGSTIRAIFAQLKTDVMGTIAGVRDALASGDLALAARIGMTGVKLVWVQIATELQIVWDKLMRYLKVALAAYIGYLAGNAVGGPLLGGGVAAGAAVAAHAATNDPGRDQRTREQGAAAQAGLREEMAGLNLRARESREEKARRETIERLDAEASASPSTRRALPDVTRALGQAERRVDVAGSFNAFGVGGMGVGRTVTDRIAAATEKTAAAAEKTERNTRDMAPRMA